MKKYAGYCRVSTDRQKEEQTIEVQKSFISEWAEKNDVQIVKWYMDDGWSGDTLERPELDNLREDANHNLWQGVAFIDRDRLARTLAYQEFVIRELLDKSIQVEFLNNPLAEDKQTRVLQQMYGIVAEMERINIAERMRKGKIHKAKSGKIVGYNAPYGYDYVQKSGDKDGYFVVNKAEAEIVKMIFEMVADKSYSIYKVIQVLYSKNIQPPKKKTEYWRKSTLQRLLKRKDYIGTSYYNKTVAVVPKSPQKAEGYKKVKKSSRKMKPTEEWIGIPVPSIVDKELFDRAQEQLETNQKYNKRNKTYEYFLSGKVYCGCGAKRVGDGVNGHHYYRCSQRIYKFPIPNKCTYQGVNAKILDEMVWNKLLSLLSNPEIIKDQLERWKKKQSKMKASSNSSVSLGKSALESLKEEEDRYTQAFGSNIFSFEKYKELMKEVNSKRKAIEDRVEENSKNVGSNFEFEDVDSVCKEVMEDLRNITKEKKQKYMRGMIESIYVKERSSAVVNGYIPLAIQAQNIQYESISRNSRFTKCRQVHIV